MKPVERVNPGNTEVLERGREEFGARSWHDAYEGLREADRACRAGTAHR